MIRRMMFAVAALWLSVSVGIAEAGLLRGPEVWLEFMGGNVRKDGLRCDLEAIKDAGFSGVHFFHIARGGGMAGMPRADPLHEREMGRCGPFPG